MIFQFLPSDIDTITVIITNIVFFFLKTTIGVEYSNHKPCVKLCSLWADGAIVTVREL